MATTDVGTADAVVGDRREHMRARELEQLRHRIREIDARLISLTAERIELCVTAGRLKAVMGLPTRNRAVEHEVCENARQSASARKLDPDVAERLVRLLIEHSVVVQSLQR